MRLEDRVGPPCGCGECIQAGVAEQEQRRDPRSGELLHGYALRRWLDAREAFMQAARKAVGASGKHAAGFEKLVNE